MEKQKQVLEYLQSNNHRVSIFTISQDLNIETKELQNLIKFLRDYKLVKATDGYGEVRFTNIEITSKGINYMQKII